MRKKNEPKTNMYHSKETIVIQAPDLGQAHTYRAGLNMLTESQPSLTLDSGVTIQHKNKL